MAEAEAAMDGDADEPITGQEEALKAELEELTLQLEALKKKVEELRVENELLQEEAHQTRVESHEYMSYMEKKSRKRQTVIISLNDRNVKELQDTGEQREKMIAEYDKKKAAIQDLLLDKEKQLAALHKEMQELAKYQMLQEDQKREISRLESEVATMKEKHTERTQALKAEFLHSQTKFEKEERARVGVLQRQANAVASQFLNEHIASVCAENQALRNELNILMDQHKELNIKKHQLSEKHKELLRQLRVQQDLARLYIDAGPADTAGEGFGTSAVEVVSTAKMGQTQGGHRESERAAIAGKAGFLPQLQGGRSVTTT